MDEMKEEEKKKEQQQKQVMDKEGVVGSYDFFLEQFL
jgi:hypothetical protein